MKTSLWLAVGLVWAAPALAADAGFLDLRPGLESEAVEAWLGERGLRAVPFGRRAKLVEGVVWPEVYASQRAILETDPSGRLTRVELVLEPAGESRGAEVLRLFEEVRKVLLRRLGPATWERSPPARERSADLLDALGSGRLVRQIQWEVEPFVRAGIPVRSDGRVEVHVVSTLEPLPRGGLLWARDDF